MERASATGMSLMERQIAARNRQALQRGSDHHRSTPLHWSEFFEHKESVKVGPDDSFNVYRAANIPLSKHWPIVVFIHGGGYSGLTWATTVKSLLNMIDVAVVAIDIRGHGETITKNDHDLSLPTMASDVVNVLKGLGLEGFSFILVGHSLGGSLAIHVTNKISSSEDNMHVAGLVVVDVVEGSALNALPNMYSILRNRPFEFRSLEAAIDWSISTGHCRDSRSSRVSVPGQLKYTRNDRPCSLDVPKPEPDGGGKQETKLENVKAVTAKRIVEPPVVQANAILEEGDEDERSDQPKVDKSLPPPPTKASPAANTSDIDTSTTCTWRVELDRTDVYWQAWFVGISSMFLSITCPRLLILAGVDRLDREMTIAQMQGKFQMKVIDRVGHTVHEDDPEEVATGLAQFFVRNKLANARRELPHAIPEC